MQKSIHTVEYVAMCEVLRSVRTDAGLTQRDLADRLDWPHSIIAKIETAERRIDPIEFCRFVTACDADPTDAFERVASQMPKPRHPRRGGRG